MCFTSYLGERGYELPVAHGVWVVQSEWPCGLVDVSGGQVGVGLQDAWLPHCHGGGAQVAEGAQVQVSRVACAERDFDHHRWLIFIEVAKLFCTLQPELRRGNLWQVSDVVAICGEIMASNQGYSGLPADSVKPIFTQFTGIFCPKLSFFSISREYLWFITSFFSS